MLKIYRFSYKINDKKNKILIHLILYTLLFVNPILSIATVDYLCANRITKELYWAEDDSPPGVIGWYSLGEQYEKPLIALQNRGYEFTRFPYKIEMSLLILFIIFDFYLYFIKV